MPQADVDRVYDLHEKVLDAMVKIQSVAVWQRQADGGWKVVRDIFNSDA